MIKPSLDQLMTKVDCKYTLVAIAAKIARRLTDEEPELANSKSTNPVSIALREIAEGYITWERTKIGIK